MKLNELEKIINEAFEDRKNVSENSEKKIIEARGLYKKILPSIVFSMQSIDSLVCYGKRVCAYRMGIKKIYDRKPALVPTNFGIKLAKQFAEDLGKFI